MKSFTKINNGICFKNANIFDPLQGKSWSADVYVKGGKIEKIANNITESLPKRTKIIDANGKMLTLGFVDIHAHFREPGGEHKETLESGSRAAMAGGFTKVCVMPNTTPVSDSPESIRNILALAKNLPIEIYPIAAMTFGLKGRNITEFGELRAAGAVAFTDDGVPVSNGQVFRYALEYAQKFGATIANHSEDPAIRNDGVMNESALSTGLGLPGNPNLAEALMIYRDCALAELTGGKLHVLHVSTREGVDVIRSFKARGANITAETTPHHIYLSEESVRNFDTNAKVAPPLRKLADCDALKKGLADGTIDCIATDHAPHAIHEKEADFQRAPFGMIGLESAFGACHTATGLPSERLIELLTTAPAAIYGLALEKIAEGSLANLNLIDLAAGWTFDVSDVHSRSQNSPFYGSAFKGKVLATLVGDTLCTELL